MILCKYILHKSNVMYLFSAYFMTKHKDNPPVLCVVCSVYCVVLCVVVCVVLCVVGSVYCIV